jgi:hypothetical protein
MEVKQTEWKAVKQQSGDLLFDFKLTPEDASDLSQLFESRAWKTYRRLLMSMKEGYQHSLLPMEDEKKIMKTLGVVVGMNLAINQLGVTVATFKKQASAFEGETKNPSQPKG